MAQLAANEARLVSNLQDVLATLKANTNANPKAIAALEAVINRLQNGDIGLNRAQANASGHPTPSDHPTASDNPGGNGNPSATNRPTPSGHPTPSSHPGASGNPGRP